ncbi:MFS transporter [Halobacteriales archaeon Cl-PHB]
MTARRQLYPLYLARFAGSLGFVTLMTLMATYIERLGATGLVAGLFVAALGVGRALAIVPVGWAADRFDKRLVLLLSLALSGVAYGLFPFVTTPAGFVLARTLQGLGIVGTGMVSLALVGDLARNDDRARQIGKYNAWRMAAGILGSVGAGATAEFVGLDPIFAVLVVLFGFAVVGVWGLVPPSGPRCGRSGPRPAAARPIRSVEGYRDVTPLYPFPWNRFESARRLAGGRATG